MFIVGYYVFIMNIIEWFRVCGRGLRMMDGCIYFLGFNDFEVIVYIVFFKFGF